MGRGVVVPFSMAEIHISPVDALNWKHLEKLLRHWLAYFGPRRLVAVATSVVAALLVVWLLIRPSAPLVESVVPQAGASLVATASTVERNGVLIVHVTGAVQKPGVYRLQMSARVIDAVTAAGGATKTADLERINLAQTLIDTEQIFVPSRTSSRPRTTVAPRLRPSRTTVPLNIPGAAAPDAAPSETSNDGRININSATAQQLDTLPGVGPTTAKAIVSYRSQKGPFSSVDDLLNVPGIGPAKFAAMKSKIRVS
jgi:competence protein ComEA